MRESGSRWRAMYAAAHAGLRVEAGADHAEPFQIGSLRVTITFTFRLACALMLSVARMRIASSVTSP